MKFITFITLSLLSCHSHSYNFFIEAEYGNRLETDAAPKKNQESFLDNNETQPGIRIEEDSNKFNTSSFNVLSVGMRFKKNELKLSKTSFETSNSNFKKIYFIRFCTINSDVNFCEGQPSAGIDTQRSVDLIGFTYSRIVPISNRFYLKPGVGAIRWSVRDKHSLRTVQKNNPSNGKQLKNKRSESNISLEIALAFRVTRSLEILSSYRSFKVDGSSTSTLGISGKYLF